MQKLEGNFSFLEGLKNPPEALYYMGDLSLLERTRVSIVGSRRPNAYTRAIVPLLASRLAKSGIAVVSGAAMGVDALAHSGAFPYTIAVMGNSLDIIYPAVNRALIEKIYKNALALSEYEKNYRPTRYSFVLRNRIVVALSEILVIAQADLDSGSMRSAKLALDLGKKIYVLPHRLGESEGTNWLLKNKMAEALYDIEEFVHALSGSGYKEEQDEFLLFCKSRPSYEEAVRRFGQKVFSYELEGKIVVENGMIRPA